MARYKNIPLKPEVYEQVKAVADANNRGLGDQVKMWVERELPTCEHEKQLVSIEIFGDADEKVTKPGWLCTTCNRVYEYTAVTHLAPATTLEAIEPTISKKRRQRVGRDI